MSVPNLRLAEDDVGTLDSADPNSEVRSLLEQRGYTLLEMLGQGNTRETWLSQYADGNFRQLRVVKIPKPITSESSATTRSNFAGGRNLDEREFITNEFEHPNIVGLIEAIPLRNRTITVEPHFAARSLADEVRFTGALTKPTRFVSVFTSVVEGLKYLRNEQLVHRDIKPENILIGSNTGAVKISDFQNVGKVTGDSTLLPTRGGAAYLNPKVLEAVVSGMPVSTRFDQDMFALGGTMYYALTRKRLFNHELVENKEGSGFALKTALGVEKKVNLQELEARINEAIEEVPRRFRRVLRATLTPRDSYSYNEVEKALAEITKPSIMQLLPTMRRYTMPFIIAAGVSLGIGTTLASDLPSDRPEISLPILKHTNSVYEVATSDEIARIANSSTLANMVLEYSKIDAAVEQTEQKTDKYVFRALEGEGINTRLAYAVLRAIIPSGLNAPTGRAPLFWGAMKDYERIMRSVGSLGSVNTDQMALDLWAEKDIGRIERVAMKETLRRCQTEQRLDEAITCYLIDETSRNRAISESGSTYYLPYTVETNERSIQMRGYRESLSPAEQQLVDRAIAHYLVTGVNGRVDRSALSPLALKLGAARRLAQDQ